MGSLAVRLCRVSDKIQPGGLKKGPSSEKQGGLFFNISTCAVRTESGEDLARQRQATCDLYRSDAADVFALGARFNKPLSFQTISLQRTEREPGSGDTGVRMLRSAPLDKSLKREPGSKASAVLKITFRKEVCRGRHGIIFYGLQRNGIISYLSGAESDT